ncbi:MAG: hypothetical protein ACJA13_001133 [Paraglaciecola sp.]|jgi:hypothetical protein
MNIKGIICLLCVFTISAEANIASDFWSAKSTDKQFNQVLTALHKTSANPAPIPVSQVKSAVKSGPVGTLKNAQSQGAKSLSSRPQAKSASPDFWVYDANVFLHDDLDYDGYFHHFSVDLDVDTYFLHAKVYARLYIGVGEDFREFHTTSDFVVDGQSSDDVFTVESELLSGFRPDDYEVLIEIYDAYNDELVAVYDGYDDSDLYLLSLESNDYETVYIEPDVVVIHAGGSLGILSLLLLPLLIVRRFSIA